MLAVFKTFSHTAAKSLHLMREVDSPQAKTEGEKQAEKDSLPQSFAAQNPAPSSEGAKSGANFTVSAVTEQDAEAKDHSMSL